MFDGLFEGLAWVLAFFFDLSHSYGVAIILLTIAVMAVVTPLTLKGTKSMMAMQRLQPEMRRLQQEFKDDKQRLNQEMLQFYRENDINPMGSCLPLLIQMPIFLVLFQVVKGMTRMGSDGTFNPNHLAETTELFQSLDRQKEMLFLSFDLEKSPLKALSERGFIVALPYLVLIALWVSTSYIQQRQVSGRNTEAMTPQQKMMMRIIPIFSLTALWFPAALSIYWVTSNLCRLLTQGYISHRFYNVGALGLGKQRGEGTAPPVIEMKVKPAKSGSSSAGGKAGGSKGTGAGGKASNGADERGKNGAASKAGRAKHNDTPPARPGRVTPAKNKAPESRVPGSAPGRRSSSSGLPSSEQPRRRIPNGPAPAAPDSNGDGVGDGPRRKRRK